MGTGRILGLSLAAVVASALPAAPAAAQTIHACVQQNTGDLKIVAAGSACPRNSSPLQWNQAGPQGPAGPAGPTGATGPAGPAAPAQDLDIQIYSDGGIGLARAYCPLGYKVVGGTGFAVDNTPLGHSLPIALTDGGIAVGPSAIGWQAVAGSVEPFPRVQAYVFCIRMS